MRRFLLTAGVVLVSAVALAATDPESMQLFLKAKEQFRFGKYADAIQTLDRLDAVSAQPGREETRSQLTPGLAFYRGACLAALDRADEARPQFETFLAYQPNASLDPAAYPQKVIAALDQARRNAKVEAQKPAATGSLATSYRAYEAPVEKSPDDSGEDWSEGPARYLLTAAQKYDYERLSDVASRSEFITNFWKSRDPKPETPENEAREEFERRVAFADVRFAQDETRGSMTDRGMVFVLLGPPTWIGRKPMRTGEDAADPSGMVIYSDQDLSNALRGTSGGRSAMIFDKMTGPNVKLPDSDGNYREIWHYRRELLPTGISFQQVDFDFITRKGYGHNVWQREDRSLTTLEAARTAVRAGAFTRASAH